MDYNITFWIFIILLGFISYLLCKENKKEPIKKNEVKKESDEVFLINAIKEMQNERISLKDLGLLTEHDTYTDYYRNDFYISEDMIVDYEGLLKYIGESNYNFGRWSKFIDKEHPIYNNAKMNYYIIDLPFKMRSKEEKIIDFVSMIVRQEEKKGFIYITFDKDKNDDNVYHVRFKHSYDKKTHYISFSVND